MTFGDEALEGEAGGFLLGFFFGCAFGFGQRGEAAFLVVDADLDAEALLVVGAALGGEGVVGLAGSGGLEALLKGGFVVADGSAEGVAGLQGEVEIGEGGVDDVLFDEGAGGGKATIEIDGGDESFEGVGEDGGLFAATALLFAAA
jgi:hypothetical protein